MNGYCPKCRSKLYPIDDAYMAKFGRCSACVTWGAAREGQAGTPHAQHAPQGVRYLNCLECLLEPRV